MSYEVKQMQKKLEDMHNKINNFSDEMNKIRTERHKLKSFNETMERVSIELGGFRDQMIQLERYSRNQHQRLRHIEDHLGVSHRPTKEKKNEIKNVAT